MPLVVQFVVRARFLSVRNAFKDTINLASNATPLVPLTPTFIKVDTALIAQTAPLAMPMAVFHALLESCSSQEIA